MLRAKCVLFREMLSTTQWEVFQVQVREWDPQPFLHEAVLKMLRLCVPFQRSEETIHVHAAAEKNTNTAAEKTGNWYLE